MSNENELSEYKFSQLEARVNSLQVDITTVHKELEAYKALESKLEKQRLTYGISLLGSILLALVGVVWSYRGIIFK